MKEVVLMKFDRSRMKSGFSLAAMVICMSLLASVVGYFLGSWMIEYVTAPEDGIQNVSSEKVVLEEKINTSKLEEENLNTSNTAQTSTLNSQPEVRQGSDNLFVVQVGAFNNQNNATRLVKKLKSIGYSAYITSQNPYKVQVGAFETEEAAAKLGRELKEDGFPVFISH